MAENTNVVVMHGAKNASYQYRIKEPYENLRCGINFVICDQLGNSGFKTSDEIEAVLLQRPAHESLLNFMKSFNAQGKISVIDTDDDINHIAHSNPVTKQYSAEAFKIYNQCLKEATYVHVTTTELKKSNKYIVFPNAIDLSKYVNPLQKIKRSVFWAGSDSHLDSLLLIKPVIKELLNNSVNVIMMSTKHGWLESLFDPHPNLTLFSTVPFEEYLFYPSMAEVVLAPLPNNRFNNAKSELRLLESGAWKIPCVASDVSPYRRFAELSGGTVLVKKERTKNWLNAIYSLLDNEQYRNDCGEKSYLCVKNHYELHLINKMREKWWRDVLKII